MTNTQKNYYQLGLATSQAAKQCRKDLLHIADYLLQTEKHNELLGQLETTYDRQLYADYLSQTLNIFSLSQLITYEPNYTNRIGVIRSIKNIIRENDIPEADDILCRCIAYFDINKQPIFEDISNCENLFLEILTLNDDNQFKKQLIENISYVFAGTISPVNAHILISAVLSQYDREIIEPREKAGLDAKRKAELEKTQKTIIKLIDPNKDAAYWNVENFYEGLIFEGGRYKANCIRTATITATGQPVKPLRGNSLDGQFRQLERLVDFTINNRQKRIEIFETHELLDKVDGRSAEKGVYRVPLKVIILYLLYNTEKYEITTTDAKLLKKIFQFSISDYFGKVPNAFYHDLFPNIDSKDIDFVIKDSRTATKNSLRRNLKKALDSLDEAGLIKLERYYVADTSNGRITRKDDPYLVKKIQKAETYAMRKTRIYDKKLKKYRHIANKSELYKYNQWDEYKQHYNDYIIENYQWSFTYQELYISANSEIDITNYLIQTFGNDKEYTNIELLKDFFQNLNTAMQSSARQRANDRQASFDKKKTNALSNSEDLENLMEIGFQYSPEEYIDGAIIPEKAIEITQSYIDNEIRKDNDAEKHEIDACKQRMKQTRRAELA